MLQIQTLGAIVPSIPVCLSTAIEKASQEDKLHVLLDLHDSTVHFAKGLEAAMLPHLGMFAQWKEEITEMMEDIYTGYNTS